jgi:hypothetical protein
VLWFLLLVAAGTVSAADDGKVGFIDPEDGHIDASEWLIEHKGFLPVPIIITEPAVGYGAGMGAIFVRDAERSRTSSTGVRPAPPDVYGIAAAATENGTRFFAAGALVNFDEDRWRYRGGVAKTDVNLDFYGVGGALGTGELRIGYNLDGLMSQQQLLRRIGQTDHYVGPRWVYLDLTSRFDPGQPVPNGQRSGRELKSSGLGLTWERDARDNIFTPSSGSIVGVDTLLFRPGIGSDSSFETYRARVFGYLPAGKEVVLAGRLDGRAARGDVPFYQLPYVDMRGIPAARYQDRSTAVAEAEVRWNVTPRWALIGFAGAARAWGERESFGEAKTVAATGVGVRYLVARRLGMFAGVDIAKGPEGGAFYIQMGSAWR